MAHKYTQVPQLQLHAQHAEVLLYALETARTLPHSLVREKQTSYGHSRAMSTGKPWYDYEDFTNAYAQQPHKERRRLRVVERWFNGSSLHGVVTIGMQYIHRGVVDVTPVHIEQLLINDGMFGDKKDVALIEQGTTDETHLHLLKLAFLSNGAVLGKLLLRGGSEAPYTGGFAEGCELAAEDFYMEQPLLEEDYRYSSIDDVDLGYIIDEVNSFVAEEAGLARVRTGLGFGNE